MSRSFLPKRPSADARLRVLGAHQGGGRQGGRGGAGHGVTGAFGCIAKVGKAVVNVPTCEIPDEVAIIYPSLYSSFLSVCQSVPSHARWPKALLTVESGEARMMGAERSLHLVSKTCSYCPPPRREGRVDEADGPWV